MKTRHRDYLQLNNPSAVVVMVYNWPIKKDWFLVYYGIPATIVMKH